MYGSEGFWWTEAGGTRILQDVLEDEYGLDLGGWLVTDPEEVRTDGEVYVVAGGGVNPSGQSEGWRAVLAVPPVAAETEAPSSALALSVAPNPARGTSTVRLVQPQPGRVRVAAYDVLGRAAAVLHDGPLSAGTHRFDLDASRLAPGVYVVRAEGPGARASRTLTVVR